MSESKTAARLAQKITSWAVPNQAEDQLWQTMTREQQLAALKERFASPECSTPTDISVAEIVERTRKARKAKPATNGNNLLHVSRAYPSYNAPPNLS